MLRQSVTMLRCRYTDYVVLRGHKLLKRTYAMELGLRNIGKIFLVNSGVLYSEKYGHTTDGDYKLLFSS
jgi:hypothetical protein